MKKKFTTCSSCDKTIFYGNAYVTIVRSVEQADHNLPKNREEITVIDSHELITFCGSCGNTFDADTIASIIHAIPTGKGRITDN
jgi:hypothetical protein